MREFLKGWTIFEIIWLGIFTFVNIYLFFDFNDTIIGLLASLSGMMCVVLAAKGRISNYVFGVANIFLYSYISFGVALYGEVMLNILIYLPLQFIGYALWKRNQLEMKSETVVKAKRLTKKNWLFLIPVIIIAGIAYMQILTVIGGQQAGVDSFAVVLSVTANILMVKRYAEQWVMWIVVNVLSIILWLNVFLAAGNSVTILVMWTAYLVNSIYGYIKWLKMSKAAVIYEDKEVAING